MYVLTEQGEIKAQKFIRNCEIWRKEILDANADTANETKLPTIEDIEVDINFMGVDEDGDYFNCWGITDNHNSKCALGLRFGVDFIEKKNKTATIVEEMAYQHFRGWGSFINRFDDFKRILNEDGIEADFPDYEYYLELANLGPAGFYEKFKDTFDFDDDYIAEYGGKKE